MIRILLVYQNYYYFCYSQSIQIVNISFWLYQNTILYNYYDSHPLLLARNNVLKSQNHNLVNYVCVSHLVNSLSLSIWTIGFIHLYFAQFHKQEANLDKLQSQSFPACILNDLLLDNDKLVYESVTQFHMSLNKETNHAND